MEFTDCPIPHAASEVITLGHGGGGLLMQQLLQQDILPHVDPEAMTHDAALVALGPHHLAMTTDSYVVNPLSFPGGDIGKLAVCGTVNDLCVAGARPLAISLGLILEEGLPRDVLRSVMHSIATAAREAGVPISTGDTKVVERGKADGLFINTAGIGVYEGERWNPSRIAPGQKILVSGDLGRHAAAIMAARQAWGMEHTVESDVAPLWEMFRALHHGTAIPACARDLTRGGLASSLYELNQASGYQFLVDESRIPVIPEVGDLCEVLGLDPLYLACEGRAVMFADPTCSDRMLAILQQFHPEACVIGEVGSLSRAEVRLRQPWGSERILALNASDPLPRIC